MFDIDTNKIIELISYNANKPLLFNDIFFFVLLLGVLFTYSIIYKKLRLRIWFLILFSYYFYYKASGYYLILLVLVSLSDYLWGYLVYKAQTIKIKKLCLAMSVFINLGLLSYFKYANFFIETVQTAMNKPITSLDILLPVGISFFIFQSMSYVIDIYRGTLKPETYLPNYLFYTAFFPQLVAGPIVCAKDFLPQINNRKVFSKEDWGEAFMLILMGLFKKCVVSDYISVNFVDRVFDAPTLYSGLENLFAIYGYAIQIYCDFSGYSDMAIGIALLFGYRFNANFNSPYASATITEFWHKWHISLSTWLKEYLYISLGGNKNGKYKMYRNLLLTMLLGGLWHGAAGRYILWGGLHGFYLVVHKLLMSFFPKLKVKGEDMSVSHRIIATFVTFNLVCFGWIFFRAESIKDGFSMLNQIFTQFNLINLFPFICGYFQIILLMVIVFAAQFTPLVLKNKVKLFFIESSWIQKSVLLLILIIFIAQIKSSDIQPFIYFQF